MESEEATLAADPVVAYLTKDELIKMAERTRKAMEKAAKELEFMEAAKLRDEYMALQKMIEVGVKQIKIITHNSCTDAFKASYR